MPISGELEQKITPDMRVKIRSLRLAIYYRLKEQAMTIDELVHGLLSEPGVELSDLNLITVALNGLRDDGFLVVVDFRTNRQKLSVESVFRTQGYA